MQLQKFSSILSVTAFGLFLGLSACNTLRDSSDVQEVVPAAGKSKLLVTFKFSALCDTEITEPRAQQPIRGLTQCYDRFDESHSLPSAYVPHGELMSMKELAHEIIDPDCKTKKAEFQISQMTHAPVSSPFYSVDCQVDGTIEPEKYDFTNEKIVSMRVLTAQDLDPLVISSEACAGASPVFLPGVTPPTYACELLGMNWAGEERRVVAIAPAINGDGYGICGLTGSLIKRAREFVFKAPAKINCYTLKN